MSSSASEIATAVRAKPLSGGLSDKVRSLLVDPRDFSASQNVTFRNYSARKRSGAIPLVRKRPKGYSLQLRSDTDQAVGIDSGNQNWNTYIAIPSYEVMRYGIGSLAWTIEFIVYLDKYAPFDQELFTWLPASAGGKPLRIYIDDSGSGSPNALQVVHEDSAGAVVNLTDPSPFRLQREVLVTIRRGGSAGTDPTALEIFYDGVLAFGGTGSVSGVNATRDGYGQMMFGRTNSAALGADFGFFGRIAEMRFWGKSRSNANVLANIRQQIQSNDADLVDLLAYYPLNRDLEFELLDESGHKHNAYLAPYIPRTTMFGSPQRRGYYFDGTHSTLRIKTGGDVFTQFKENAKAANLRQFSVEVGWTPGGFPEAGQTNVILDFRNLCTLRTNPNRTFSVQFYDGGAAATLFTSTTVLNPGQRYFFTITRQDATFSVRLNGVSEPGSPGATASTVDITYFGDDWYIGSEDNGANGNNKHAPGWLDELRVWAININLSNIAANVNKRLPAETVGLISGGAAEAQFLGFQSTKACTVTQGSATINAINGAQSHGIFSSDAAKGLIVFPSPVATNSDGSSACKHILTFVSNVNLTMSSTYGFSDASGGFPINGKECKFTHLVYWIDCSKDILDPDVYRLPGRVQRKLNASIWSITRAAFVEPTFPESVDGVHLDPRFANWIPAFPEAVPNNDSTVSAQLMRPKDCIPRFSSGFFEPDETPITGAKFFKKSGSTDSFWMAAAGHSLYWVDPKWSNQKPFTEASDPTGRSLRLNGRDSVRVPYDANKGITFGAAQSITLEAWIYPYAVDGVRFIASKLFGTSQFEYALFIQDGKLAISWHSNGGANQFTFSTASAAIRTNKWQHIAISVSQSGSGRIFVDGVHQIETTTGSVAGAAATDTKDFYLGFNPNYTGTGTGFFGLIDEFRFSRVQRYLSDWFLVQSAPFSDDVDTAILMHFDEGQDVFCADAGTLGPTVRAHGELIGDFWIPITHSLLTSSIESPSQMAAYRDRLYHTNGINYPVRVDWDGDLALDNYGFRVTRMGMAQPALAPVALPDISSPSVGGDPFQAGDTLIFYYTYYNPAKGIESFPSPKTTATVGVGVSWKRINLHVFPSEDPQATQIRIYQSVKGGGIAHLVATIEGESRDFLIFSYNASVITAGQEVSFENGEAPTAKYFRFDQGFSYFANSPDLSTAFFVSQPGNVESFSPLDVLRLDSPHGDPISGLSGGFGVTFAHQKRAIFTVQSADLFENFIVNLSQADQGSIGGQAIVTIGGIDYFRGTRSFVAFNGTDVSDIGGKIETTYRGRIEDPTNFPGLNFSNVESSYGLHWERGNEILWTARRKGSARNDLIISVALTVEGQPWSLHKGLELSVIALGENLDGQRNLVGFSYTGYPYILDSGQIDGSSKPTQLDNSTAVVSTTVSSFSAGTRPVITTLSSLLDTLADGYKGIFCTVLRRTAGKIVNIDRKRILFSTANTLTLESALNFTPVSGDVVIVGAIEAFVDSGWLDYGAPELSKWNHFFDCSFVPIAGANFDFYWETATKTSHTIREQIDRAVAKQQRVSMSEGYTEGVPLDRNNKGKFVRFELYSVDSEVSPEWMDYEIRADAEYQGHGRG